jgi:HAD superfamily phosphatase (TIGR01668 family)
MFRLFTPHFRLARAWELTPERLCEMGLDALLLDADCTIKRYGCDEALPEAVAWLAELRACGIGVCLVSNGWAGRIGRFAEKLGLPFEAKAMKPLPSGCSRAVRKMGFDRARTAIVGDQVFADIMAGRLAGLTTILVTPIHPEEERWFTRLKRPPERWLLRWLSDDVRNFGGNTP